MLKHKPIIPPDEMNDKCIVCGKNINTCKEPPVCDNEGCKFELEIEWGFNKMVKDFKDGKI